MSTAPSRSRPQRVAVEVGLTLLLVCLARTSLAASYTVASGSMQPSLLIGDRMLAEPFAYGYSTATLPFGDHLPHGVRIFGRLPARGDIIVFRAPAAPGTSWVKRVIGVPGDHVRMQAGRLWLNGQRVAWTNGGLVDEELADGSGATAERFTEILPGGQPHAILKRDAHNPLDDTPDILVPVGHLFVLGDNRDDSADSRVPVAAGGVGLLPIWNLQGRVEIVLASRDLAPGASGPAAWLASFRPGRFMHVTR
ncbi:signal peptidase I [Lichenicola sp.]|uniref:signal peptidase I n=1 Tax=Lichenicola sp. TaxID=2804529 RepID=UPI003B00B47F